MIEVATRPRRSHRIWTGSFLTGLALWVASVLVTATTGDLNMVPTVVLLGSFLVPVTGVLWYLDHYQNPVLTPVVVLRAFIVGGVLGVLAASLLESWLLADGLLLYAAVGLVEEMAKLAALVVVARRLTVHGIRDGIVLGAAVGFGFAALESSGYAFTALLVLAPQGAVLSLPNLVLTELIRGVLAPVGHGLWTAILGGVLFGSTRNGRLRPSWKLLLTYLGVALLHTLYDAARGIAALILAALASFRVEVGVGPGPMELPSASLVLAFVGLELATILVVSAAGLLWLMRLWRRGTAPDPAPSIGRVPMSG